MLSLDEGSSVIFHRTMFVRVTTVATGVKVATLVTVRSLSVAHPSPPFGPFKNLRDDRLVINPAIFTQKICTVMILRKFDDFVSR